MKFNEKLLELRKQKGWSQEELGEKINVSRQTISKYEVGQSTPEMDKLIEISKIFGITIDELVGKEINKEETAQNGKRRNNLLWIFLIILFIIVVIFLYKCISFTSIYLKAKSFDEKNYIMMEYFKNEDENANLTHRITRNEDYIRHDTYTQNYERPDIIEYTNFKDKRAYILYYNRNDGKYTYKEKSGELANNENIEDYIDEVFNTNVIRETTLSQIPSNIKDIILSSLNPFCNVSVRNKVIYNNFIWSSTKNRIRLTNDGLIERYDVMEEYNDKLTVNFSYDYVQEHFANINEVEPAIEFKDIIVYEENQ